MANETRNRNPLLAWWIGLGIILAVIAYAAYRFACLECSPAGFLEFMILGIVPAVYLVLMYLTLKSQADREKG
jgi:Na+-transporting methylmalonyl-CoA/oxaloacetate decarboxylase beta subunit